MLTLREIFVAPDGLNKGWANQGGEDITFIDTIRQKIDDDLCVNEKLRFSMGFSYGAAMSYSLGCSKAKDFRAIAVLSGARTYNHAAICRLCVELNVRRTAFTILRFLEKSIHQPIPHLDNSN
jgi:poly(3-hydroxybutyrate) depolymerase